MSEVLSVKEKNTLFPVFLKLEQLRVLLIGGGNVALEKLQAIVNNAPATRLCIVAKEMNPDFAQFVAQLNHAEVHIIEYDPSFLDQCDIVIAAVNDLELSKKIQADAKEKQKLINVADKPQLCDFYLGSIVTKGNLKLAISTNGKSPTMAKRLKEVFNDMLPEELDDVLDNLQKIRKSLNGDFKNKVLELNKLTEVLVEKPVSDAEKYEQYWFL